MSELRTEEEQIEAIKNWWRKNGGSLLIGIGLALAVIFGWQAWQNHVQSEHAAAQNQFNSLMTALQEADQDKRAESVGYIAEKLKDDYGDTSYAVYGTLVLAQIQISDQNDVEAAIESLEWATNHSDRSTALQLLIASRLARAYYAAGRYDDALDALAKIKKPGAFEPTIAELRGDILLEQGDVQAAREAYQQAADATEGPITTLLSAKMADLGLQGEG